MLVQLNKALTDKLTLKFITVHTLAKHCHPFIDYTCQCSLDEIKVKTDFHNKLGNLALNDLLRIMLLSPPEAEFNPEKATNHWFGALEHRESLQR